MMKISGLPVYAVLYTDVYSDGIFMIMYVRKQHDN